MKANQIVKNRKVSLRTYLLSLATVIVVLFASFGYVFSQSSSQPIYLDDLPATVSYVVKTDGTNCWAVRYDGLVLSASESTDALVTFQAVESVISANATIFVRHGDYTFSAQWSSSKQLHLLGEGSGTRLLPSGAFDVIDQSNLSLMNIIWRDANGIDNNFDSSFPPSLEYENKGLYWFSYLDGIFVISGTAYGVQFLTNDSNPEVRHYGENLHIMPNDAVADVYIQLYRLIEGQRVECSWSKNRRFRVQWFPTAVGISDVFLFMGYVDATISDLTLNHVGFKLLADGKLYGSVGNNTVETTAILDNAYDGLSHTLECKVFALTKAEFFVDGVLKGTIITGLPFDTSFTEEIMYIWNKQTTIAQTGLRIDYWEFMQEP